MTFANTIDLKKCRNILPLNCFESWH